MISALAAFLVLFFIRKGRWFAPAALVVGMTTLFFFVRLAFSFPGSACYIFSSDTIVTNIRSTYKLAVETISGTPPGQPLLQPSLARFLPEPVMLSSANCPENIVIDLGARRGERLGTFRWRLYWWETIIDYTIKGPYFWLGKGYGINLADSDGFQVTRDHSLRSPHNATMNFLARSGWPGLILWLAFLLALGIAMFSGVISKRFAPGLREQLLWLLAYWLAFLLNSSVDVFLEGPMGGVWFWSLVGLILLTLAEGQPRGTMSLENAATAA